MAETPKNDGETDPAPAKVEHDPALKNETCFHFPDCLFMWAWFASVIIMFWIAMQYGVAEMEEQYQEYVDQQDLTVDEAESQIDDSVSDAVVGCKNVIKIFGVAMGFAVVMSFLWTGILVLFGELLITALFFAAIGLLGFIGARLPPRASAPRVPRAPTSSTLSRTHAARAARPRVDTTRLHLHVQPRGRVRLLHRHRVLCARGPMPLVLLLHPSAHPLRVAVRYSCDARARGGGGFCRDGARVALVCVCVCVG